MKASQAWAPCGHPPRCGPCRGGLFVLNPPPPAGGVGCYNPPPPPPWGRGGGVRTQTPTVFVPKNTQLVSFFLPPPPPPPPHFLPKKPPICTISPQRNPRPNFFFHQDHTFAPFCTKKNPAPSSTPPPPQLAPVLTKTNPQLLSLSKKTPFCTNFCQKTHLHHFFLTRPPPPGLKIWRCLVKKQELFLVTTGVVFW